MLSQKIGKKISETLLSVKEISCKEKGESEQWLDYYVNINILNITEKRWRSWSLSKEHY